LRLGLPIGQRKQSAYAKLHGGVVRERAVTQIKTYIKKVNVAPLFKLLN